MDNLVISCLGKVFRIIWILMVWVAGSVPSTYAQNFVVNGNLESFTKLPDDMSQWRQCIGWDNLNYNGDSSTPDYYHRQAFGLDDRNTKIIQIEYFEGDAIIGFVPTGPIPPTGSPYGHQAREYIAGKVIQEMEPGRKYIFSYWFTNGNVIKTTGYSCNGMGISFSTEPLTQDNLGLIRTMPHYLRTDQLWSEEWTQLHFSFTADSAFRFFTVGNFLEDSLVQFVNQVSEPSFYPYYYFDDFEIRPGWPYLYGDTVICPGDTAKLTSFNNYPCQWFELSKPDSILSVDSVLYISPSKTTTYVLRGSEDTLSISVLVKEIGLEDLGRDTTICTGQPFYLKVPEPHPDDWEWNDGSSTLFREVNNEGLYEISMYKDGCLIKDSIRVESKYCDCLVSIPNSFSPNHDGLNDIFLPRFECRTDEYEMQIYSTWGELIFESSNVLFGWNGEIKNTVLASGVYYYRMNYLLSNGERGQEIGTLMLVK